MPYLSFRPVTLALVGLATCGWLAMRDRRRGGGRGVWLAVPITAVLANVHLYALLVPAAGGLLVVGDWIDGQPVRRTVALALALAAAAVATPMLPGVVHSALFYATGDAMVSGPVIAEMRPWRDPFSILLPGRRGVGRRPVGRAERVQAVGGGGGRRRAGHGPVLAGAGDRRLPGAGGGAAGHEVRPRDRPAAGDGSR